MMTLALIAKVSFIYCVALLATTVARRQSASWRALVLASSLAVSLVLPVAAPFAAAIEVRIPELSPATAATTAANAPVMRVLDPQAVDAPVSTVSPEPANTAAAILQMVWLTGALMSMIPMFVSFQRVRSIRRRSTVARIGVDGHNGDTGAEVRMSNAVTVPMVVGVGRPVVLLPETAAEWNAEELSRALRHELEHVRRKDAWTTVIGRIAVAVHWFNPLAWITWRRCLLQIECACDDAVVAAGSHAAYAEQLVSVARQLNRRSARSALAMVKRSDLAIRVHAILDPFAARHRVTSTAALTTIALTCLLAALVAPLQLGATQQGAEPELQPRPAPIKGGATVYGLVQDPTGAPLEGLLLILEKECFGPTAGRQCGYDTWTRSDRYGRFRFTGLPAGPFHITSPIDFVPGIKFQVAMGETLERDITMAIETVVSEFTICAACAGIVVPESLAKEFEADRQDSLEHPVTAPRPAGGWEYYRPGNGDYPTELRDAGVEGTVTIEGVIGIDGVPAAIKTQSTNASLARAAVAALAAELWEPGRVRGVAVEVPFRFLIRYKLKD